MTTTPVAARVYRRCHVIGNLSQTVDTSTRNTNHSNLTAFQANLDNGVSATVSYCIGGLMVIVFILGVFENATVLFVYMKTPKLRNLNTIFIVALSISDTGQTVLNIPFVAAASFSRGWIFGHLGCMYIGFVTTFFGLSQISLLTIIAVERYFVIVHHSKKLSASNQRAVCTIVSCFIYGAGWAFGPLVGWSEYKLVAGEISCSLCWKTTNGLYLSYTLSLLAFAWFLPLTIILFGYVRIALMIYREKYRRQAMGLTKLDKRKARERQVAITVLLMVGAFVMSWAPYSIVALLTMFGDIDTAPNGVYLVPAAFAKASIIWNPIIYVSRHKAYRHACQRTLKHLFFNSSGKYKWNSYFSNDSQKDSKQEKSEAIKTNSLWKTDRYTFDCDHVCQGTVANVIRTKCIDNHTIYTKVHQSHSSRSNVRFQERQKEISFEIRDYNAKLLNNQISNQENTAENKVYDTHADRRKENYAFGVDLKVCSVETGRGNNKTKECYSAISKVIEGTCECDIRQSDV